VANRVLWSLVFLAILLWVTHGWARAFAVARSRRNVTILGVAAVFLAVNWGVYVWAVAAGLVFEASLGYFINPLVSVALGVVILRERLRRAQWVAVGIAILAVLVLTVSYGRPPWISLILAFTFGTYGLLKKQADVGSVESLTVETAILSPVALGVIVVMAVRGSSALAGGTGYEGWQTTVLLVLLGPITALPLLAFGGAATRIPLSTLGLMQYFTPVGQFLLGVFVFDETMTTSRWIGFILVWISLVIMTVDGIRNARAASAAGATTPQSVPVTEPD
jgi:chloramphenicol-sensitive protein RarD